MRTCRCSYMAFPSFDTLNVTLVTHDPRNGPNEDISCVVAGCTAHVKSSACGMCCYALGKGQLRVIDAQAGEACVASVGQLVLWLASASV